MNFRFCVLTAVSTEDQATEEKESLAYQLHRAREFGEKWGGTFVREYRAEGFSRSGWWDLTETFRQCEAFAELARDAKLHLFDVVIVESYDRLGDLAMAFFNYFAAQGAPYIQLISVQQRIMIEEPREYHPRQDDSIPNALADSLKNNKTRTNKIFRAGQVGIPARAKAGKYARRLPTGYTFTGTKKEYKVDLDPVIKALLIDLKNKYLAGWTFPALAELAESVTHTHWRRGTIKDIFLNPFYAGKTFHDRGYTDKKTNGYKLKEETVELYDGLHESCWDIETYHLLASEVKRRGEHLRHKRTYPLSGLVVCGTCNQNMHAVPARNQNYQYYTYYRCRWCKRAIRENVVMAEFVRALRSRMSEFQDAPLSKPEPVDNSRAIASLRKQLDKIRTAYETTDSYTAEEYAERKRAIMREIEKLENVERQQEEQVREQRRQRDALLLVRDLLPGIETWMEITPPGEVNVQLSMVVECVTVHADKTVRVTLR
jgi:hypothetical protein